MKAPIGCGASVTPFLAGYQSDDKPGEASIYAGLDAVTLTHIGEPT